MAIHRHHGKKAVGEDAWKRPRCGDWGKWGRWDEDEGEDGDEADFLPETFAMGELSR